MRGEGELEGEDCEDDDAFLVCLGEGEPGEAVV